MVRDTAGLKDPLAKVEIFDDDIEKEKLEVEVVAGAELAAGKDSVLIRLFERSGGESDASRMSVMRESAVDTLVNFSTLTTGVGFEIGGRTADDVAAVDRDVIMRWPDLTLLILLIFMLTPPALGEGLTLATVGRSVSFVGGRPDSTGLSDAVVCLGAGVGVAAGRGGGADVGRGAALLGRGMSSFLPNSELRAEAGTFPRLRRFVGPCRDSTRGKEKNENV